MDDWARAQIEALQKRVGELEQQVFGGEKTPPGPESDPELLALIGSGDDIRAIKRWVDMTGDSLADAKAGVERLKPTVF